MFEANPTHLEDLQKSGLHFFITALSDKVESKKYFSTGSTGDSFYKELTVHYENCEPQVIKTNTLNDLMRSKGLKIPQLIKIDTQGSELDILTGASHFIDKVYFLYLECPLSKYNEGAPSFDEYIDFLKSNGFVPCGAGEISCRPKNYHFIRMDILFYNSNLLKF